MHMHTYIHASMHKYIQYMHAHVHTHKCTVMQICSTYSSELSVRVFLDTYDAQCS